MKIKAIQVARFGVWQQLSLAVPNRGVALFYGPNEAGKTTLSRFIRSILYGFEPFAVELYDGTSRPVGWEGLLRVESQGHEYEIRRISDRGTRGLVSVVGTDREQPAESLLAELLHRTDESLFENVFAVGLNELQEMSTLQGDEVARHIYGLTLGPTGRRLLEATSAIDQQRRDLLDPASRTGRLADLLERDQTLRDEIVGSHALREEHAERCRERARIEDRIENLQRKQADAAQQLSGHRLLSRVWPHWNEARAIRRELETIPEVSRFPADGVERLKSLDAQVAASSESRQALHESVKALRAKLQCFAGHKELHTHSASLVGFVEQAGWYRDVTQQAAAAKSREEEVRSTLDRSLESLGPDWTYERLESLDTGVGARRRLMSAASRYRAVLRRRNRMMHTRKRLSRVVGKRGAALDEKLKGLGDRSLEETIAAQIAHLKGLDDLARLRLQEADLTARLDRLHTQSAHQSEPMPGFIPKFLGMLLAAGLAVTLVGLYQAASMDVFAGIGMACIGFCGLGVTWGLKHHLDHSSHRASGTGADESEQIDAQLQETRATIARLTAVPQSAPAPTAGPEATPENVPETPNEGPAQPATSAVDDAQRHRQALARLAELERWNRARRGIRLRRRRLSELRTRFQGVQRDLSAERQNWCELLKSLGHSETVKVDDALDSWDRAAEARDHLRSWKSAGDEHCNLERSVQSFHTRMSEAGRRAGRTDFEGKPALDVLAAWDGELKSLGVVRDEYRRTRRELKDHRRKLVKAERQLRRFRAQLSGLLVQGGAADRNEFLERAGWIERRHECEARLEIANEDLRTAAAEEPELAIVEEDLENFDADHNQERIDSLSDELAQIERDRHAAFEELGGVKQALKSLEADCQASQLRFEHSQTRHELARAAEEWLGIELARQAVDHVRSKFERTCQPATLALASKYLEQLTRGKYGNVWTPLGQRELRIDDERGQSLSVEQLSGGTREQLFLAVRMATVHELGQKGIDLPMVFDDVLVNFDQVRTEAAVDTLCEFAEENRQILFFTCHLHLAHLFESRGVEPTWLPGHNLPQQERRAG
jgi:uncharacterized protein YhaN